MKPLTLSASLRTRRDSQLELAGGKLLDESSELFTQCASELKNQSCPVLRCPEVRGGLKSD